MTWIDRVFGTEQPYLYVLLAIAAVSALALLLYAHLWRRCSDQGVRASIAVCGCVIFLLNGMLWSCFRPVSVKPQMTKRELVGWLGTMTTAEFANRYEVTTDDGKTYYVREKE